MRHATAPGTGDPANFRLGQCETQRNLNAQGRAEARRWGELLARQGLNPPSSAAEGRRKLRSDLPAGAGASRIARLCSPQHAAAVQLAALPIASLIDAHRSNVAALNLAHHQFAALMANSSSMIFIKDMAGRYLHVSHSYAELMGATPSAMVGTQLAQWVDDATTLARLTTIDQEVMQSHQSQQSEEVLVRAGVSHVLLNMTFPLLDDHQQLTGLGGIAVDVTVQREEEQRLARKAERERERKMGRPGKGLRNRG